MAPPGCDASDETYYFGYSEDVWMCLLAFKDIQHELNILDAMEIRKHQKQADAWARHLCRHQSSKKQHCGVHRAMHGHEH